MATLGARGGGFQGGPTVSVGNECAKSIDPTGTVGPPKAGQARWHPVVESVPLRADDDALGSGSVLGEVLALLRTGGLGGGHGGGGDGAQRAVGVLTHGVASDPYDSAMWHNLGAAWLRVRDGSQQRAYASDCFRKAVRLDATCAASHAGLAQVTSSPKESVQAAHAALAIEPGHVRAQRLLAWGYLALDLPGLAVEVIGACAARRPHDAAVLADQAAILLRVRGGQGGAREAIAKACEVAPHWPKLWRLRWEAAVV
jgi:hypothetical protein